MTDVLAWHFVGDTLRDGRPIPPDGEWLRHDGPVVPCRSGLHASVRIIDALDYAPGSTVCRVALRGDIMEHVGDKIVGRERKILWRVDAEAVLRTFARSCALDVIHLWDAPAIVRDYLETGDETKRAAAWAAARAAARDDARDAARDAARAAAWAAASDAARDAARAAARDDARDDARDAARDAARAAAWDAARAAAWAAARDAALDAAWDAARAAARDAQDARLATMIREAAGRMED